MPMVDVDDGNETEEEEKEDVDGEIIGNEVKPLWVSIRELRGPDEYFLDSSKNVLSSLLGEDDDMDNGTLKLSP